MAIERTPIYGTNQMADTKENKLLTFIRQNVAQSVNVVNDTVSITRREADIFYDGIPIDRLRPDTNGPRVIMNDCQAAVDRVVAQVAKAYYEERSVEAVATNEEDKEAADQCTKMTRHAIFSLNKGKLLLRDSIKSAAKYAFGGGIKIVRCEKEEYSDYTLYLDGAGDIDEAEEMARMIAVKNTQEDYVVWKLLKVKEEKFETPAVFDGKPVVNEKGKIIAQEDYRYKAIFEICKYVVFHDLLLIPPEELLINKNATCVDDANFVAQRKLLPRTDIIDMWPEAAEMIGEGEMLTYTATFNTGFSNEKQYRRRIHNTLNITSRPALSDPSMQECLVVEGYIRFDWHQTGKAVWMHFSMVDNVLLHYEEWRGPIPFILPNLNRDPHRPDEVTVVERAKDSQLSKTAILRSDIKAHQGRNALQIIARMNGFPLTGQRKLLEGTPGIIPFGNNEQGAPNGNSISATGPISDHIQVIAKPDPSQASVAMLGYIDQQKGSQVGVNNLNDVANSHYSRTSPATNAAIQQRSQDIAIEDYIMVYGETAMKPLFQKMWWFIVQDASHPCLKERFIKLTGKPCLDVDKGQIGEFFQRDEFKVNVGLGVDSPEYQQTKAMFMLQLLGSFNQQISTMMPNLAPKAFYAYQEAVKSLGYDPDVMLLTKDEFTQWHQNLLQIQQTKQPEPDPVQMATVKLLDAQSKEQESKAQLNLANIPKAQADAQKSLAQAGKEHQEAIHMPEKLRNEREMANANLQSNERINRENNASKERTNRESNYAKQSMAQQKSKPEKEPA